MNRALPESGTRERPGWLEVIRGRAPVLLIAPHGGHAGAAARSRANPRINDLHTAELTDELARRLSATALINRGMDRNRLDLNRLDELAEHAPWFLALLADELEEMLSRHPRVLVLSIHGWNIIEPRIDFGIGARMIQRELRPVGSARLTAGAKFINGPLAELLSHLTSDGIVPTLGYRYPAGGRQNLLQALTDRDLEARRGPAARLARLAAQNLIDALQMELSIAVRWPGPLREQALTRICRAFAPAPVAITEPHRTVRSRSARRLPRDTPPLRQRSPWRFALEFYDPAARIGVIASADLAGGGSRLAVIMGGRVALCTADGLPALTPTRVRMGPLGLDARGRRITLNFRGPLLTVPDSAAYTRIEAALSGATLSSDASLHCVLDLANDAEAFVFPTAFAPDAVHHASFGTVRGELSFGGTVHRLNAMGRIGLPPLDPFDPAMTSRRALWASVVGHPDLAAFEVGMVRRGQQEAQRYARVHRAGGPLACTIGELWAEPLLPGAPPPTIKAQLALAHGRTISVTARPQCYMATARPGAGNARIYTSVGFANFELDGVIGTGMFECADLTLFDSSRDPEQDED